MVSEEILLKFCTGTQTDNVKAYFAAGENYRAAGRNLGKAHQTIRSTVKRALKRASAAGHVDGFPSMPVGDGRSLGKMTYTGKVVDGEVVVDRVWPRTNPVLDSIEDALQEMCECVAGKAPKVRAPRNISSDLLSVYNIGDMHFGQLSWGEETGVDFDLSIACKDLLNGMSDLIARSERAETAIILNLGDAIHFHDDTHTTKGHKNPLDADGRVDKVFRITVHVLNTLVEMALQKHKKVIVRNVRGNHDEELSMAIRYQMHAWWRNEKRVTIEMHPSEFWYYQFGRVMLMATHGHTCKPADMISIMSARQPVMWGQTYCRRALHGHFHSRSTIPCRGGKVYGVENMSPNDAWHDGKGYTSELECTLIEFHRSGKEIGQKYFQLLQSEVGNSDDAGMFGKL